MSRTHFMTLRRAVTYVGGVSLLAAWLASAASYSRQADAPPPQPAPPESPTDRLVADVQAQAARLRERLASAPAPQQPIRNPFAFQQREVRVARRMPAAPQPLFAPMLPPPPPEPALFLAGVAEDQTPAGPVRIAMLTTRGDDVLLAKVGEMVLDRYRVTAIGADVVELHDTTTGTIRRLALR